MDDYLVVILMIPLIDSSLDVNLYVTQLRSGEDPELRNTLKNASY